MTRPHYYVPTGGHPAQTELTTDRAMFTEAYAVLPRPATASRSRVTRRAVAPAAASDAGSPGTGVLIGSRT